MFYHFWPTEIKKCQKAFLLRICQISDQISIQACYRTIEFPTSLWIKNPIPWCWNTFLGDNNFGGGKKGTSSQIDGTLGLRKDTLLFSIFCFKRKLARKICYGPHILNIGKKQGGPRLLGEIFRFSMCNSLSQKCFSSFVTFSLRLEKSHVVGKVIMAVQWDHDIVHFLPSWHKTIRLLYCSIFFHHRPPLTDYLTDTLPFGAENTQEIHVNMGYLQLCGELNSNVMEKLPGYFHLD